MTQVTYIQANGDIVEITANHGDHLMQTALANGVEGILGACGGSCMCATCHVRVDHVVGILPSASEMETEILAMEVENPDPNSRLGCQIFAHDDVQAITVTVMQE